jgi:hypothetical protein
MPNVKQEEQRSHINIYIARMIKFPCASSPRHENMCLGRGVRVKSMNFYIMWIWVLASCFGNVLPGNKLIVKIE